jgi:hypothetical protein
MPEHFPLLVSSSFYRQASPYDNEVIMSDDPDPEEIHKYLASPNFSRSIRCPLTGISISFSEIGDLEGCPVLFIPGAVCSRWLPVPLGTSTSITVDLKLGM